MWGGGRGRERFRLFLNLLHTFFWKTSPVIMENYGLLADADDGYNLSILEMKRLAETLTTPVGADIPEAFLGVSSLLAFTARWSAWYLEKQTRISAHNIIIICCITMIIVTFLHIIIIT